MRASLSRMLERARRFFGPEVQLDLETANRLHNALLGDVAASETQHHLTCPDRAADWYEFVSRLHLSGAGISATSARSSKLHLLAIHAARLQLVRHLLPPASKILDLGGANAPLYRMGYPHAFQKLVLVDLPPDMRHEDFREVSVERLADGGEVVLQYSDMTELASFVDETFDLVWSGQSIEHVSLEQGRKMCLQAFRVLRRGGAFCLDTPNRLLTKLHTGNGYIHPDHKHEYTPQELRTMLLQSGFEIVEEKGICEMPLSLRSGSFTYDDFFVGGAISNNLEGSYIQFFHCRKP